MKLKHLLQSKMLCVNYNIYIYSKNKRSLICWIVVGPLEYCSSKRLSRVCLHCDALGFCNTPAENAAPIEVAGPDVNAGQQHDTGFGTLVLLDPLTSESHRSPSMFVEGLGLWLKLKLLLKLLGIKRSGLFQRP